MRSGNFAKLALFALAGVICTLLTAGPGSGTIHRVFGRHQRGLRWRHLDPDRLPAFPCSFFGSCQTQITCPPGEYLSDGSCYEISGDGHYRMSGGLMSGRREL